jgi:hypothetical protein
MSACAEVQKSNVLPCLEGTPVRFSFILEEMPKRLSFAPLSYDLQELRKSLRFQQDSYEDDIEDHDE